MSNVDRRTQYQCYLIISLWKPLHTIRREIKLTLLYKIIINNLVAIPPDDHLTFNTRPNRKNLSLTTN